MTAVLTDVGHGFREAFFMLWDTLWALVLGFTISGAVQAFVSRERLQRHLGDHGPAAIGRASAYGAASSSCSYAASAMAGSLFARGADFVAATVFMIASTNLVIELGIALVALIGWQFLAAEYVGGIIMIVLMAVAGSLWFRGRALAEARAIAGSRKGGSEDGVEGGGARRPWRERVRTASGWADAAGYAMGDLKMLRKEMVVGFVAAGFLAALVPTQVWNALFVHGHGGWTTVENAAIGPLVAIASFVCSVGNVPLAAALWKGGISFGGVVSFVFADLITLPLLLVYRKQYGTRMAVRMLVVFWVVMAVAGLITEELFRLLGWLPRTHPAAIAADALRLDATTILDVVALVVIAGLWWLHRHRDRFGDDTGFATDPVCGMQVDTHLAAATTVHDGTTHYFCSGGCRDAFTGDPARFEGADR